MLPPRGSRLTEPTTVPYNKVTYNIAFMRHFQTWEYVEDPKAHGGKMVKVKWAHDERKDGEVRNRAGHVAPARPCTFSPSLPTALQSSH